MATSTMALVMWEQKAEDTCIIVLSILLSCYMKVVDGGAKYANLVRIVPATLAGHRITKSIFDLLATISVLKWSTGFVVLESWKRLHSSKVHGGNNSTSG